MITPSLYVPKQFFLSNEYWISGPGKMKNLKLWFIYHIHLIILFHIFWLFSYLKRSLDIYPDTTSLAKVLSKKFDLKRLAEYFISMNKYLKIAELFDYPMYIYL